MAVNQIQLKRGAAPGGWTQPTDILVRRPGAQWATVRQGWLKQAAAAGGWVKIYELTMDPPATVTMGAAPTFTSATVSWAAVPGSNVTYQVVMRPGITGSSTVYPTATTWTANLSLVISSLAKDTTYTFTVQARRLLSDGSFLVSKESTAKVILNTGHPAAPITGSRTGVIVTAARSDTWTSNNTWFTYDAGEVVQGYASVAAKNGYGCVRYHTLYSQLKTNPNIPDEAVDTITIVDAKIEHIRRLAGGAGTPSIHVYPALIDFNASARPSAAGTGTTFNPPVEGDARDNVDFADTDKLKNWVQTWVRIKSGLGTSHNGLLIFNNPSPDTGNDTAGYNGYCVFRGANVAPSDWRLVLSVSWSYGQLVAVPPTWSTA